MNLKPWDGGNRASQALTGGQPLGVLFHAKLSVA